jgi:LPS export ABC transporter protein LptC
MNIRDHFLNLVLFVFLFSVNCKNEKFEDKIPAELPKIQLEKFCLTETKLGRKLWILNAHRALVYDELVNVDTVEITFFDEKEVEFSRLTAPKGKLNNRTHNIMVCDSVVVCTSDSTKLFTDTLFWQNDSQSILTNSWVKIVKQDSTVIEGKGLKTDPHLQRIEIIGETKGVSPMILPEIK